ncbi:hypothetical protein [Parageobacillus toebii]|uniref:hypothetical protein n=1 Tax=Parageobacillus toebii TaxID=153151 RepID=UPI000787EA34|nr:hypothetical protein [Parageobacillus toebii]
MQTLDVRHQKTTMKYENSLASTTIFGTGATIALQTMDSTRNGDCYCCCIVYACGGAVNKTKN